MTGVKSSVCLEMLGWGWRRVECVIAIYYLIPTYLPTRKGNVETLISSPVYECIFIL